MFLLWPVCMYVCQKRADSHKADYSLAAEVSKEELLYGRLRGFSGIGWNGKGGAKAVNRNWK